MSMSSYGLRIGLFFAALFLIYGVYIPYLPLWLDWRGLTAAEIGIVTSAPYFARLVATPAIGYAADAIGDHARIVRWLAWTALAAALASSQSSGFTMLLGTTLVLAMAAWSINPLAETIAIGGVRKGLDYGRMRLWGSLTFILASFAGGAAVDIAGRGSGIWLIFAGCAITVAASYLLPGPEGVTAGVQRRRIDPTIVLRLARHRLFLLFLLSIGSIQASHAMFYTFGAIHWRDMGLSTAWIGSLWAIGVLTEVALFAWSGRVAGWLGPITLLVLGASGAIVRWTAMSGSPILPWLVPLQMLHGLTYGASHLGAIHFIGRAVPTSASGTAQALYATVAAGIFHGLATMVSGLAYARFGESAYFAMAALAAIGLGAALVLRQLWTGGPLWDDSAGDPNAAEGRRLKA